MATERHFHLGTILNPVWVNDPRVDQGYMGPEGDDVVNLGLMPFVHTLTIPIGGPTDTFVNVVPQAVHHMSVSDELDAACLSAFTVTPGPPGTELSVCPESGSSSSAIVDHEDALVIGLSTFYSLQDAIDELDDWPPFASENTATFNSSAFNPNIVEDGNSHYALQSPRPESEPASEPMTPEDEIDVLATQLQDLKGKRADNIIEGLYREIDEVAAEWSLEVGSEHESTGDTTVSSAQSTMEALLQEVREAVQEWSVLGEA